MSNITEWIKYELYPRLFDSIDIALPEHNFKRYAGGWRSKTYLDGSPHKDREDKTVITKDRIGLILEQGGEVLTLVDYTQRRDVVNFITAVETLADSIGLTVPNNSNYDKESYKKYKDQITLLEDANSYFVFCLDNSKGAEEIKAYLSSRGYLQTDIKAMGLGYIPSKEQLNTYLLIKEYSQDLIDEVIKLDSRVGSTHSLTIPYRSGGSIKGFKFRTIGDATPKYLNSTGLDRNGGFFNLLAVRGDKDIVIVEGELDALHATAKGVENVVATGGSGVNSEQVKDAIKRGAKKFTVCFDTETGKEEETAKKVNSVIEIILAEGVNRVYTVTLPDNGGKVDTDSFIKDNGVDSYKEQINKALPYYEYQFNIIVTKYGNIEKKRSLEAKDIHNLEDEVVALSLNLQPTDKDRLIKLFTNLAAIAEIGITEESLAITLDRLTSTRDKEAQAKDLKELLNKATKLQERGEVKEALELIEYKVKEVKLKDKITEFSNLLKPIKEDELKQRIATKPDSLNSGYKIGDEELLLPSGAISIFTAPTSHGKTTFLINLALNITETYTDKEAYLFSYEEDGDSVLIKALNAYMGEHFSNRNTTTIQNYYANKNRAELPPSKDKFFNELIETNRLNIHYCNYNSDTLVDAIRYLHKHARPGAIFIDYVQLLNLPQGKYKTYSRQEEIKEICIALKDVAIETGLPIILGAQFNRTVTNHLGLQATNIGEAGDIERIANLIVGFWNNNFTPTTTEPEANEIRSRGINIPNTLYCKILKQRGGKVGGDANLEFNGNEGKIKNSSSSTSYFE